MHQAVDSEELDLTEDSPAYTYANLYRMVTLEDSIIVYIDAPDLPKIKKGMSNAKMKQRKRNKDAGFDEEDERLDFQVLTISKEELSKYGQGAIKLQISLAEPPMVPIHGVFVADKEL